MGTGLEGELDEELGYSKYDYRNKETDNSRNGYNEKTLRTSLGDLELAVPRHRKGEFKPQIVKRNQTTLSGNIEEKILSMYAKGMTTVNRNCFPQNRNPAMRDSPDSQQHKICLLQGDYK